MKAAVLMEPGVLELQERPEPAPPGTGEALVAVEACGICGSDVQALAVPPGHPSTPGVILGHEMVGRVEALGDAPGDLAIGDRVVVDPDPSCGFCHFCRRGLPAACENTLPNGVHLDGGLTRLCKVPVRAAFRIGDAVPAPLATLAEPFACVVNGARRAAVQPGESAVVFGGGAMGCMFAAMFRAAGAGPLVLVEPSPRRREVARDLGIPFVLAPEELAAAREELLPHGADVVVDAVGSVLPAAIETATTGGRIVLIGMDTRAHAPVTQNELTRRSLTIIGSYVTHFTFPAAIALIEQGVPDLRPLITHVLSLDEIADGLELIRRGEAMKVVITLA